MAPDSGHLARFVAEAREHLALIGEALIALEREPEDRGACVERLLRGTHSLKGGAGFTGQRQIERLAHAMETATEQLRDGEIAVDAGAIDALLFATDRITALVDDVEHSEEADISEPLRGLAALRGGEAEGADEGKDEERAEVRPVLVGRERQTGAGADPGEFTVLARGHAMPAEKNQSLYGVKFDWYACESELGLSPVRVAGRLHGVGTILDSRLEFAGPGLREGVPQPPAWYRAVIASRLSPEEFARRLGIPIAGIVRLENIANGANGANGGSGARVGSVKVESAASRTSPAPTSLRISVSLIDQMMELASELALVRNQALRSAGKESSAVRGLVRRLDAVTSDLQDAALQMRMQPLGTLFDRFPRLVRDVARQLGKEIDIVITGSAVELDKTVLEVLSDPLTHLIRNCCDHGIEMPEQRVRGGKETKGVIRLSARQERGQIIIEIRDDGKGIDVEAVKRKALEQGLKTREELRRLNTRQACDLILMSGLSTAAKVTDLSGRGVGMDIVKTNLEQIGGVVEIDTVAGKGTVFTLRLPLTLAIMPCQLVQSGGQRYAIPQRDVEEILLLDQGRGEGRAGVRIECTHDGEALRLRGRLLPVVRLSEVFGRRQAFTSETWREIVEKYHGSGGGGEGSKSRAYAAVVRAGSRRFVQVFDDVLENEDIVVKPLGHLLRPLSAYGACAILGDGGVVMILSTEGIARHSGVFQNEVEEDLASLPGELEAGEPVLLATCGDGERVAIPLGAVRSVSRVVRSSIQRAGNREFVNTEGATLNVVSLQALLGLNGAEMREECFLVVPRRTGTPMGFLVSEIVDTVGLSEAVNRESVVMDGVSGTVLIGGRVALVLDVERLAVIWEQAVGKQVRALPAGGRKRVLLVEDTQFFQTLVGKALRDEGYEVRVAGHGREGLEALERETFDLVVSDIEMPTMDGHAFAKEVRGAGRWLGLPMLALTTLSGEEHRRATAASGYDAHETKFDRAHFLATVERLLGQSAAGRSGMEVAKHE